MKKNIKEEYDVNCGGIKPEMLNTELVFILDRSGSMGGLESDTIGGFNSMIEKQKKFDGECHVTTVLFDNEIETIHDRLELKNVKKLTDKEYYVRGCTALLDAVGQTIKHIESVHKYIRKEDVPENVLFVITTDGFENASKEYSSQMVKELIEEKKKLGWEFIFMGANIDAVETARAYGIDERYAVKYKNTKKGVTKNFEALDAMCFSVRQSGRVNRNWKEKVDEDK